MLTTFLMLAAQSLFHSHVTCIDAAPEGSVVAIGRADGFVHVVDVETGATSTTLRANGRVDRVAWVAEGTRLATISAPCWHWGAPEDAQGAAEWELWDPHVEDPIARIEIDAPRACPELIPAPDTHRLALLGIGRGARIVDADDFEHSLELTPRTRETFTCAAWSPDGNTIALGTNAGTVELYDAHDGALTLRSEHSLENVRCLAFDPASARLIACGTEDAAIVLDSKTGDLERALRSRTDSCFGSGFECAQFDTDGVLVFLTTCHRVSVQAWSPVRRRFVWWNDLGAGGPWMQHMAIAPRGDALACWGASREAARILSKTDGRTLADWSDHNVLKGPQSVAWTADGRFVTATNGRLLVFDAQSFELRDRLVPSERDLVSRAADDARIAQRR